MSDTDGRDDTVFGMTGLEEALRGPDGDFVQAGLVVRLDKLQARIRDAIAAGLPPEDFGRAQLLLKGLAAARMIVVDFPARSIRQS